MPSVSTASRAAAAVRRDVAPCMARRVLPPVGLRRDCRYRSTLSATMDEPAHTTGTPVPGMALAPTKNIFLNVACLWERKGNVDSERRGCEHAVPTCTL